MQNEYQGLIFTNHALDRMKQRGISQQQVWETHKFPDFQDESKNNATERRKRFGDATVTIIYKHNERHETIIVSVWMDPPLPGSRDAKEKEWWQKYKKAGFWGKLWLQFMKQIAG